MAPTFEKYGKGRAHCPVSLVSEVCFPSLFTPLFSLIEKKGEGEFSLSSLLSSLSLR